MAKSAPFQLIAGHAALDFANTLDNRYSPAGELELLQSYGDLLRFCAQARILTPARVRGLHRSSSRSGAGASAATLRSALHLRETIERIFSAIARDGALANNCGHPRRKAPATSDLAILNGYVKDALARRRIVPVTASASATSMASNGAAFVWEWMGQGSDLSAPFWPLALVAAELLVSDQCVLVRECRCASCRWLFLDSSKNHSRRWCDMKTCGNRAKARRYYRKRRAHQTQ